MAKSVRCSLFTADDLEGKSDEFLTDSAICYIENNSPDFVFLYLVCTDHIGHEYGWGSEKYLKGISHSFDCIEKVYNSVGDDYTIIVTADHGGHDRRHGENIPEDMTIPLILISDEFKSDKKNLLNTSIMDVAPTIADLIGIPREEDWEGKSLV